MRYTRLTRSTLLITVSVALAACTSMRVVPTGSGASTGSGSHSPQALAPGDVVKVKLRDGSSFEFTLTSVSSNELQGVKSDATTSEAISMKYVEVVERKQFDALKTTLLVVVVAVGIYFVAQALLVSKLLGSS